MSRIEHLRYLDCLGLLADCSAYVPEDLRDLIEQALADACVENPSLHVQRFLNRIEIELREGGKEAADGE